MNPKDRFALFNGWSSKPCRFAALSDPPTDTASVESKRDTSPRDVFNKNNDDDDDDNDNNTNTQNIRGDPLWLATRGSLGLCLQR